MWTLLALQWEVSSKLHLLKLFRIYWSGNNRDIGIWCSPTVDGHAPLGLIGMGIERSEVLNVALTNVWFKTYSLPFSHGVFPFPFWLFQDLLVSNQSSVDGIGPQDGLSIQQRLIVVLLLVDSSKLASFITSYGRILTSSLDALLLSLSTSQKRLVGHGLDWLSVVIHLLMKKLWLTIGLLFWRHLVRVVIHNALGWVFSISLGGLLNDLLRLGLGYLRRQTVFNFKLFQLLLEILCD